MSKAKEKAVERLMVSSLFAEGAESKEDNILKRHSERVLEAIDIALCEQIKEIRKWLDSFDYDERHKILVKEFDRKFGGKV